MNSKQAKHLIIVTSYKAPQFIKKCVESLDRTINPKFSQVVVVDDGSDPKTRKIVKSLENRFPNFYFVFNKKNIGKPRSVNNILRRYQKMEYYTILDQDVFIRTKNWDRLLFKAHQVFNNRAILGAYTLEKGFPFRKGSFHFLDPYPFWTLAGRFFSFSSEIFNKLGYLYDKSFRHEDREYCWRAYLAGYKWYYLTDIKAKTIDHPLTKRRRFELNRGVQENKAIQRRRNNYLMLTHDIYYNPFKKRKR